MCRYLAALLVFCQLWVLYLDLLLCRQVAQLVLGLPHRVDLVPDLCKDHMADLLAVQSQLV